MWKEGNGKKLPSQWIPLQLLRASTKKMNRRRMSLHNCCYRFSIHMRVRCPALWKYPAQGQRLNPEALRANYENKEIFRQRTIRIPCFCIVLALTSFPVNATPAIFFLSQYIHIYIISRKKECDGDCTDCETCLQAIWL